MFSFAILKNASTQYKLKKNLDWKISNPATSANNSSNTNRNYNGRYNTNRTNNKITHNQTWNRKKIPMGSLTSIDTNSSNSIVHYLSLIVHTDVSKLVQIYSMILGGRHQPTFGIARTDPTFWPFFARTYLPTPTRPPSNLLIKIPFSHQHKIDF